MGSPPTRRLLLGLFLGALAAPGQAQEATDRRRAPASRPFVGGTTEGTGIRRRAPTAPQATPRSAPNPRRRGYTGTPIDGQGI